VLDFPGLDLLVFDVDGFILVRRSLATIFEDLKGGVPSCCRAIEPLVEVIEKLGTLLERTVMVDLGGWTVQYILDVRLGVLDDTLEFSEVGEIAGTAALGPSFAFLLVK
jgi:hypothetical protein